MPIPYTVFRRDGRPFFEVQWEDPITGKARTKTTKENTRREAEKFAATLIADLEAGGTVDRDRATWQQVVDAYSRDVLVSLAESTARKTKSTFAAIREHVNPGLAKALTAPVIRGFAKSLRDAGRRPDTICGHLAELRKVLGWAHRQGFIKSIPAIEFPPRSGMKGRPITREEFERMLEAALPVVKQKRVRSWRYVLNGLWVSGLRLEEAMRLTWDESALWVDLSGKRPLLRIQSHAQKKRRHTITPITPCFAELLEQTPPEGRTGFVFNPQPWGRKIKGRPSAAWVGKVLTKIGRKATVKVAELPPRPGANVPRIKWASAHDLRRSFGERWSLKVMPALLMKLMRHESISTTLEFYTGRDATDAAESLWVDATNDSTNTGGKPADSDAPPAKKHA